MKQISIKIKFGALIGILIAIVIITISMVLLNQRKKILIEKIKREGFILSKTLASSATEGITTSDELIIFQAIEDIMKGEGKKGGVENAFVLNKDGEVIAHSDENEIGKEYNIIEWNANYKEDVGKIEPRLFKQNNELMYDFLYPIYAKTFKRGKIKNVLLGTAHIIFSYKIISNAIKEATITIIITSAIILIIAVGASFFLARLIVKPIMEIAKGAEEIGKGNLKYKISVHTKDELEFLSNQFNEMTVKLAEAQDAMLEQERLKYELDIATSIQDSLIPKKIPEVKDLKISTYYNSAKEVGGDYYDFYKLDENRLGFIIADVSGKGVPGAMVMVMVRSILKSQVYINDTAFHTILNTNKMLEGDIKKGMFITAFYGIIDTSQSMLQFVNAGHNQLLILRKKTGKCEIHEEHGMPLGTPSTSKFEDSLKGKFIPIKKGDIILQYTDGITEAKNANMDDYEMKRLIAVVERNKNQSLDTIIKSIIDDVNFFCGKEPQYDDIALVAIKV